MKSSSATIALALLLPEGGASAHGPAAKRLRKRTIYKSDARSLRAIAGGRDAAAASSNSNRRRRLQGQTNFPAPLAEAPDNLFDRPRFDALGGLSIPNLDFSFSYLSFELGNAAMQADGVNEGGPGPSSTQNRPEISEWKAMARLIWSDASKGFTFDSFGGETTCGWGDDQECVPILTYGEVGAGARDACEKAMISAFQDPRLDRNIEKNILFDSDENVFGIGCASLIAASEDAYPGSNELDNARSAFLDGSEVTAPNPFNIKPIDENDEQESYAIFLGMASMSIGSMSMGSTSMSISLSVTTTTETPEVELSTPTATAPPNVIHDGTSYCAYAPDKTCYIDGWPSCCGREWCPVEQPPCEVTAEEEHYDPFLGIVSMSMGSMPMESMSMKSMSMESMSMESMSMESMFIGSKSMGSMSMPMSMSMPATTTVEPSGVETSMPTAVPTNTVLVGPRYCTLAPPDTTCYVNRWPSCCYSGSCPVERPPCDVTAVTSKPTSMSTRSPMVVYEEAPAPLITPAVTSTNTILFGASYCTHAPDTTCYVAGWPGCCYGGSCPIEQPPCDVNTVASKPTLMPTNSPADVDEGSLMSGEPTRAPQIGGLTDSINSKPTSYPTQNFGCSLCRPGQYEINANITFDGKGQTCTQVHNWFLENHWENSAHCREGREALSESCCADSTPGPPASPPASPPTPHPTPDQALAPSTSLVCSFCSGGITVEDAVIIPDTNQTTCGLAEHRATALEETSSGCAALKDSESICCPAAPEVPCSFCAKSNGISAADDLVVPQGDGITCGSAALHAAWIEDASEECARAKLAEYVCCPDVVENPCTFCDGGFAVEDASFIPDADGMTCELAGWYASSIEASAEECRTLQLGEAACCPTFPEQCPFSTDGLTVDPGYIVGDTTCGLTREYASSISMEDERCATLQLAERFCCPLLPAESSNAPSKSPAGAPSYTPSKSPEAAVPIATAPPAVPPGGPSVSEPLPAGPALASPPSGSVSSATEAGSILLAPVIFATAIFQLL